MISGLLSFYCSTDGYEFGREIITTTTTTSTTTSNRLQPTTPRPAVPQELEEQGSVSGRSETQTTTMVAALIATFVLLAWVGTLVGVVLIYRYKTKSDSSENEVLSNSFEDERKNRRKTSEKTGDVYENRGFIAENNGDVARPDGVTLDM